MKIFKKNLKIKFGQSMVDFVLISVAVTIALLLATMAFNPSLFKTYFKTSFGADSTIDSGGQLSIPDLGD